MIFCFGDLSMKNEHNTKGNEIIIRTATVDDAQSLLDIYGYYVENSSLSFEYAVPTVEEFRSRIASTLEFYPYLVAQSGDGEVIGYAYASCLNPRAAYSWNAVLSIYLKKDARRCGIGRRLYTKLEELLVAQGFVKSIVHLTLPVDEYSDFNSKQFHEHMGFRLVGQLDNTGYKFGRWYSIIYMDKQIAEPRVPVAMPRPFDEIRAEFDL